MRSLFVMDPLSTIHVDRDSSYALMLAWQARGGEVWHCGPKDLRVEGDALLAEASRLSAGPRPKVADVLERRTLSSREVAVVWKRSDPPFDMGYVFCTYMLDVAARHTLVLNDPAGLRDANEKMAILRFPALTPRTLITREIPRIRAFLADSGGRCVVKPWDGNGGRGVFVLERGDRNLASLMETATRDGRDYVVVQEYLPAVRKGDKRILLVDGAARGAFLRIPPDDDHRGNMHVGASVEACEMTARDREICDALAPWLREKGLVFAGIDVIGDKLTEINVTSPTGMQECQRLYGSDIAGEVVEAALHRRKSR
jgi:glutathione synthase